MEVEWVEVRGRTVDIAVEAALEELGLSDRTMADVEVIDEGEKGTLGFGRKDAVVRVKPRPQQKKRRRRRPNKSKDDEQAQPAASPKGQRSRPPAQKKAESAKKPPAKELVVDREEQATVVRDFLTGMLDAFGLEGDVVVGVEDEAVVATVEGDQTEALVGDKAAILQSVLELTRTVVQRQTHDGVRIRLDIAGYRQRRREALVIYAGRLAERVLGDDEELQLEPMNAADRKVIHDAIADIDGVRSYSEGDDPRRFVVLGPDSTETDSND